ncbi:universal stress protein [Aquimonas voraii]|uniref:Nucleotide-binding universal stress protein, UspA family n=1 Tax=Aquimonas voraii TaxID=265719 RepID=A0A1G6V0T8_9GAMM|nr:universal stress protein [Aquimonas voraii]SDD47220.1 Nucleotide-binding universal stress protein, UspA family [Aquimonas voraii]
MRILVAIDGSHYGDAALAHALELNARLNQPADITLIHVALSAPPRAASAVGGEILHSYYQQEHDAALAKARETLKAAQLGVTEITSVGAPGRQIAEHANAGAFDLVVMGSHGHGALTGLLLGSTVSAVLSLTKVPLLIVR